MKSNRWKWFLLVLGLILVGPQPFFILSDYHEDQTIAMIPVGFREQVTVEWVHSVELTPWRETYEVEWPAKIKLVQTAFKSFGAGVPAQFDHASMRVENGWALVSGLGEIRNSVIYLISRSDYKLTVGESTWILTEHVPLDTSLEMKVQWRPWWCRYLYSLT